MSDHIEHACPHCGSFLHFEDRCPHRLSGKSQEKKQETASAMCGGPPSRRGSPNMPRDGEGVKGGQKEGRYPSQEDLDAMAQKVRSGEAPSMTSQLILHRNRTTPPSYQATRVAPSGGLVVFTRGEDGNLQAHWIKKG